MTKLFLFSYSLFLLLFLILYFLLKANWFLWLQIFYVWKILSSLDMELRFHYSNPLHISYWLYKKIFHTEYLYNHFLSRSLGYSWFNYCFKLLLIVFAVNQKMIPRNLFIYTGEYLALTGDKLNGVEMMACGLATHYSLNAVCFSLFLCLCFIFWPTLVLLTVFVFSWQRLAMLEERLGKLITDEPSVVEASLAQYGDIVYPDKSSVLHR